MTLTSLDYSSDYSSSSVAVTYRCGVKVNTSNTSDPFIIPVPDRISPATYGYCLATRGARGGYPGLTITPGSDLAPTLEAMLGSEYAEAGRYLQPVAPMIGGRRPEIYLVLHPKMDLRGEYPVVVGCERGIFGIFADVLKTNTYPAIGVRLWGGDPRRIRP